MKAIKYIILSSVLMALALFQGCSPAEGENPGREYMPDMGHSIAYEANTHNFYRHNTWSTSDELKAMNMPRKPVAGTVPRGYASVGLATSFSEREAAMARFANEKVNIPINGSVPYYYADTEEDRTRAIADITSNPFLPTSKGLEVGKTLYDINCGICHGEAAAGDGYLVRDNGGKYPAQPANLINEEFTKASDGRFYHAIMHGKNVMGGYADKLSYEERWQVIHYIRSLQAKNLGLEYKLADATNATSMKAEFDALMKKVKEEGAASAGAITLKNVVFNTGSDKLTGDSEEELMKLVDMMGEYPDLKVEISGHTDDRGDDDNNKTLSDKRAKSVKNFLVGHGITEDHMTAIGYGEAKPVADNETEEGRAQNRRTEFRIIE